MFRKIISNLPFSSTLVEQLGVYAKRIKKEETTRKLGLLFIALTIIVQLFILMQPPESANARDDIVNLESATSSLQKKGIELSVNATSITQGFTNAANIIAKPQEQISYTLTIRNTTAKPETAEIANNLSDLLEYAKLIDDGGGILSSSNILSWPETTISPNSTQTRTYSIRLLQDIPATANGLNNNRSFDCKLTNIFGNTLEVPVDCPAPKIAEQIISSLPKTNQSISILLAALTLLLVIFFYARARQIKKELLLIRKDLNSGVI